MNINFFKLCSGLKVLGYSMILFVVAIITLSYYAVVIFTCLPHLHHGGLQSFVHLIIIIVFHLLLILLLWSYVMVVLSDPGVVPENWSATLSPENMEAASSMTLSGHVVPEVMASTSTNFDGMERRGTQGYCLRCHNGKPPRCHHCSVCQRCVLKMDHHCVWVVNCVGARNYKFFLLFLVYTFLETILDTLTLLPEFIHFFHDAKHYSASPEKLSILCLAFVLNVAFALSLLCFVIMHVSLVSSNTTSIEVYEKKKNVRWKYDLGRKKNFEQVFGTKKALWFFPLFSKEDLDNTPALHGLDFPTGSNVLA